MLVCLGRKLNIDMHVRSFQSMASNEVVTWTCLTTITMVRSLMRSKRCDYTSLHSPLLHGMNTASLT